jgi:hypothetical protein
MEYVGQSDADARRGRHSGVIRVQPTNVSNAAQHSRHLAPRQFLFNIVVLQKAGIAASLR